MKARDFVSEVKFRELERHTYTDGDIVMTKLGDPLGVSAIVGGIAPGLIVADLVRIRPSSIDTRFLCYQLNSPFMRAFLNGQQKGTTRPRVNLFMVRGLPISVPPFAEQGRIVEILEEQFSRLDSALASIRTVREKAKAFRRSLLHAAVSGSFSASGTDGWVQISLGNLCDLYQPRTISKKELKADGEFIVFGANGVIGRYDKFNHEDAEVTVTCRGATCGTVNVTTPKAWITGNAMVCHPKDGRLTKEFLAIMLQQIDFSRVITGTAQPQITRKPLAEVPTTVPPLAEQQRIVEIVDEQFSHLDAALAIANQLEARIASEHRSLLHSAFSGALTARWRKPHNG